jgi:DeoR family ulaG and ulaABCDEF operon transcriptional repressor
VLHEVRERREAVKGRNVLERERQSFIMKLVEERSFVSVTDLLGILDVSEATIRRDITALAERGEIKRIRGGAETLRPRQPTPLKGMPFNVSSGIAAAQKRAIARAAAALIAPADSVLINGGTTTYALAEFMTHQQVDILTNSFPIAAALLATSHNRVTLPGGTIFREQNIILSPFQDDSMGNFWGRKLFTSCYAINRLGLMETDPLIVQAQTKLLQRAEEVVVLADSRKLRQHSSMIVAGLDRISTLVTDDGATREELEVFAAANVHVVIAEVTTDDQVYARMLSRAQRPSPATPLAASP